MCIKFAIFKKPYIGRLMADTNDIKLPATPRPFGVLKEHLVAFRPLRLSAMGFEARSYHASTMHMQK